MRFRIRPTAAICSVVMIGVAQWMTAPDQTLAQTLAQTPATQPAARQATTETAANEPARNAPIRRWFDRLADPDPKVREQAKMDLMGLSSADLPRLRQLVIDHQPILPAQAAALHDIVIQVFLANDPYDAIDANQAANNGVSPYFLGVLWPPNQLESDARLGVTIDERLPGFPSYRYLRTGDMVLGVYLDPTASLLQFPNTETHTRDQLINAIGSNPNVQSIVLQVLRDGQQIRISLKMAPRPVVADKFTPGSLSPFLADRADRADAYWQENFVPLLETRQAQVSAD